MRHGLLATWHDSSSKTKNPRKINNPTHLIQLSLSSQQQHMLCYAIDDPISSLSPPPKAPHHKTFDFPFSVSLERWLVQPQDPPSPSTSPPLSLINPLQSPNPISHFPLISPKFPPFQLFTNPQRPNSLQGPLMSPKKTNPPQNSLIHQHPPWILLPRSLRISTNAVWKRSSRCWTPEFMNAGLVGISMMRLLVTHPTLYHQGCNSTNCPMTGGARRAGRPGASLRARVWRLRGLHRISSLDWVVIHWLLGKRLCLYMEACSFSLCCSCLVTFCNNRPSLYLFVCVLEIYLWYVKIEEFQVKLDDLK